MQSGINVRLQLSYSDFALDLDLQLPGKGITALYGHSGSGKTTCLRCIAGLERASQAYVEVNGEVWQDSRRNLFVPVHKRALGYVFQEASLFAHLSVRSNLAFGLRRIARNQRSVELADAAQLLGISHLLDRSPSHLSGGERQRVAIARAMVHQPKILIADEPTGNLDPKNSWEIVRLLAKINKFGTTVLLITHSTEIVNRLNTRVITLDEGKVVSDVAHGGYRQ